MSIFIGADHRGFEFKNKIVEYLQQRNVRVEDMGAYQYDPEDDYPDFAIKVAQAVLQNPKEFLGIVICGSGIGVSIAANRYKGIRCGCALNTEQVKHGKENDHINVLSLASDYTDFETAKKIVDAFVDTPTKQEEKYQRRIDKLDR